MELDNVFCLNERDEQGRAIVRNIVTGEESCWLTDEELAKMVTTGKVRGKQ